MTGFICVLASDQTTPTATSSTSATVAPTINETAKTSASTLPSTGSRHKTGIKQGLFVLADYLQAEDFQDAYIERMAESYAAKRATGNGVVPYPDRAQAVLFYDELISSPFARKFVVDWCLYTWHQWNYEQDFRNWPMGFVWDLMKAAAPYVRSKKATTAAEKVFDAAGMCRYHQHTANGGQCYRVKYHHLDGQ